jgi:uncharacterized protein (DUF3820 family)
MSMDGFEDYVNSRHERLNNEQQRLNLLQDEMKEKGYNALLRQTIKFGKYKNYSYFMLPKSYVEWMKSKNMLLAEILEAFKLYEQIEQTERSISHLMRDPYD